MEIILGNLKFFLTDDLSSAKVIGGDAKDTSLEIPSHIEVKGEAVPVKTIGKYCFDSLPLKEILLPDTIEVIEEGAFEGTNIENLKLPVSLKHIKEDAFRHCYELSSLIIPPSITFIPYRCFLGDKKLQFEKFPESIIEVDTCGFQGVRFPQLNLPSNVKKIGWDSFKLCGIINLKAQEGLEEIGPGAFGNNYDLETIDLPSSLKIIGEGAFKVCPSIKKFIIRAIEPPYLHEDFRERGYFDKDILSTMVLYVPSQSLDLYKNHQTWGQIKNIVAL